MSDDRPANGLYRTMGLTVPVAEVLNVRLWRDRYAWGIPLAGSDAFTPKQQLVEACQALNENDVQQQVQALVAQIPDHVIRWHLRAALSELEMRLAIPMGLVVVKSPDLDAHVVQGRDFDRLDPRRPWKFQDAMYHYRLDLPYNVVSVERIRAYMYGTRIIECDNNGNNGPLSIGRIVLEWPSQGSVHILPVNMSAIIQGPSMSDYALSIWELMFRQQRSVPDFWSFDYTLGPWDRMTHTPGQIEAVLAHWVYLRAGKLLINMAGTAYGQGIASTSLSFDGFSRTITTSQSAMYGINSAMELVFQGLTDSIDWRTIKRYKRGLKVFTLQ